jgi:hypothetical protein
VRAAGLLLDSVSEEEKKRKKEREKGELRLPSFPHQNRDRKFKKKKKKKNSQLRQRHRRRRRPLLRDEGPRARCLRSPSVEGPPRRACQVLVDPGRDRAADAVQGLSFSVFFLFFFFWKCWGVEKKRERERGRDNKEKLTSFFFSTFPLDHAKKKHPQLPFQYRGRPHWGKVRSEIRKGRKRENESERKISKKKTRSLSPPKPEQKKTFSQNFARTFTNPNCPVRDLYPKFDALLAQQAIHDPRKVFEPPLFSAVKARSGPVTTAPLCALRKLCYCSADEQCAAGWACRPGRAFPQFNVCVPAGLSWA